MPIGIVSDEEFLAELNNSPSPKKTPEVTILEKERPGRSEGDTNVPEPVRKIIGETSVIEGRQAALGIASMFGVSPSQVSAYANGAHSTKTYDTPVKSLIGHINKSRERAIKRAQKTLNGALGAITQEKLDYSDAKDLSGIAKDMSVIIKNLEPEKAATPDEGTKQQFVIFAPTFKDERSYDTINVQE